MCAKQQACQSSHSQSSVSSDCCAPAKKAAPTIRRITPETSAHKFIAQDAAVQDSQCCDAGECQTAKPNDEDSGRIESSATAAMKQSWYVTGMDCPACAAKLEKAISSIAGVEQAKVLFATEKLVVNVQSASLATTVEQVALQTGFPLTAQPVKTKPDQKRWRTVLKDNLNIILIALGMVIAGLLGDVAPQWSQWLFTLTCVAGLLPVVKQAVNLARSGTPFAIETLMSVAALGALYLGESVEAAMVLLLFLIGEKLEAYAASRARSGVQALMELVPEQCTRIVDGRRVETAVSELSPGDVVEIAPGGRLPADGMIVDTSASFDQSALTGESVPVTLHPGEKVMAGSVVVDKVVQLKVVSKQGENAIDRILHLIEEAESRKAPLERFLDKFSRWYTPLMMVVAALVIVTPPLLFAQPWETWVYRGLALLLIACPCALVISTPAAITSGLAAAAKRGALIKGGAALERLGTVEAVAFDKTGTLTQGKPQVTDIVPMGRFENNDVLRLAAAVEIGSSHPLATALVAKAQQAELTIPDASEKSVLVGIGVQGWVDGQLVSVSAPDKAAITLNEQETASVVQLEGQGKTVAVVSQDTVLIGLVAWQDTLREGAAQAVKALSALKVKSVMLTGDNPRSAEAIANQIDIDFEASLLPVDKVRFVEQYAQNNHVAMVGDGINDAPAMKAATIGIAMGGGTDVALETADAALTHNRLQELPVMIELSRATMRNIRQNITLALGLKAIFLVTSLFGFTGLWVAVLADSGATALVTLNALRLLRFKSRIT